MPDKTSFFDTHLREDEYIIWHGEATTIIRPFRVSGLLYRLILAIGIIIFATFVILLIMMIIFLVVIGITEADFELVMIGLLILVSIFASRFVLSSPLSTSVSSEPFMPWTKNQYAITNQRVLLYEDGRISETSLILMQDAVKTKPKSGKSDINLYNQRSPTGQLPAPIATLNNLSETDAEAAYDLLIHARDISFEERIEDLGLD